MNLTTVTSLNSIDNCLFLYIISLFKSGHEKNQKTTVSNVHNLRLSQSLKKIITFTLLLCIWGFATVLIVTKYT